MQEGLANICLITAAMTITKLKIERSMPKKKTVSILFIHILYIFSTLFLSYMRGLSYYFSIG